VRGIGPIQFTFPACTNDRVFVVLQVDSFTVYRVSGSRRCNISQSPPARGVASCAAHGRRDPERRLLDVIKNLQYPNRRCHTPATNPCKKQITLTQSERIICRHQTPLPQLQFSDVRPRASIEAGGSSRCPRWQPRSINEPRELVRKRDDRSVHFHAGSTNQPPFLLVKFVAVTPTLQFHQHLRHASQTGSLCGSRCMPE